MKKMSDIKYLNRLFKEYYKDNKDKMPLVNSFDKREFGFIPWDTQTRMLRHMSFMDIGQFVKQLANIGPRHVYSSGALYINPENQEMEKKRYNIRNISV